MRENAQRQAARDLSTIKALVDLMVRDHDLSFRAAHHVEGAVVHRSMDNRVPADLIDAEMVESAAIEQLGKPLGIDAEAVRACLDPIKNVNARISTGDPSPLMLRAHASTAFERLSEAKVAIKGWRDRIDQAHADL